MCYLDHLHMYSSVAQGHVAVLLPTIQLQNSFHLAKLAFGPIKQCLPLPPAALATIILLSVPMFLHSGPHLSGVMQRFSFRDWLLSFNV